MIKDFNDINEATPEGKLLLTAIVKIALESQKDKTPNQVISQLNELNGSIVTGEHPLTMQINFM